MTSDTINTSTDNILQLENLGIYIDRCNASTFKNLKDSLKKEGIDLYDVNYKKTEKYQKMKYRWVFSNHYDVMSLEEFIERFLLTPEQVSQTYESIFDMGNHIEIQEHLCDYTTLASEIMRVRELNENRVNEETRNRDAKVFVKKLFRKGGLKKWLKDDLNFDIDLFANDNHKEQCEILKILYLFHMIEKKNLPNTTGDREPKSILLKQLSNYSMENTDMSIVKAQTCNGAITQEIINSLSKEMSLDLKAYIKKAPLKVVAEWEIFIERVAMGIDMVKGHCQELNFAELFNTLSSAPDEITRLTRDVKYHHSPIATMYLKMICSEYLGHLNDLKLTNETGAKTEYTVPLAMVEELKEISLNHKTRGDVKDYLTDNKNVQRIAKYVYLKPETSKDERRWIRKTQTIETVLNLLDCLEHNKPGLFDSNGNFSELLIISCLQAMLFDSKVERTYNGKCERSFLYTFPNYQKHNEKLLSRSKEIRLHSGLKGDKSPYTAVNVYTVRKVMDWWNANIGRHTERKNMIALELLCDSVLECLLDIPNVNTMLQTHSVYIRKFYAALDFDHEVISAMCEFKQQMLFQRLGI
jgi:hypothetical protein